MLQVLLLFGLLFQASSEPSLNMAVDNDRVTVWDVNGSATSQSEDAVIISYSGGAVFVRKGTQPKTTGRFIIIDLKNHAVAPMENTSGFPLAFPRPGAKKLLENDRVIVWDCSWTQDVATPMHFHDKDVVALFLENGELKSTTPDGQSSITFFTEGTIRFNARNRTHSEALVRGQQHAIITELK